MLHRIVSHRVGGRMAAIGLLVGMTALPSLADHMDGKMSQRSMDGLSSYDKITLHKMMHGLSADEKTMVDGMMSRMSVADKKMLVKKDDPAGKKLMSTRMSPEEHAVVKKMLMNQRMDERMFMEFEQCPMCKGWYQATPTGKEDHMKMHDKMGDKMDHKMGKM